MPRTKSTTTLDRQLKIRCTAQEHADWTFLAKIRNTTLAEVIRNGLRLTLNAQCLCPPEGGSMCPKCRGTNKPASEPASTAKTPTPQPPTQQTPDDDFTPPWM